ncbi:MAG: Hsp20/alpha crystallin family protein [Elusimicrobia bacterium]|jgi:HSP20 family protein|nr:Hsp20/alpha crystallin family protein [Elusimicrobiota bacterium]
MTDKEMVPSGDKRETGSMGVWTPFGSFSREMDRLFDDVGRGWGIAPFRLFEPRTSADRIPRLDIAETEKEIRVTAELPGMDEKDVDVSLEGDLLTLKGEKKAEAEEKGKNFHHMERSYGSFLRTVRLPMEVDPTKVTAGFKKGVLTVTLTKSPAAQNRTRKIEVKAE